MSVFVLVENATLAADDSTNQLCLFCTKASNPPSVVAARCVDTALERKSPGRGHADPLVNCGAFVGLLSKKVNSRGAQAVFTKSAC